jgi:DNA-binding transcriptional MerR regulator
MMKSSNALRTIGEAAEILEIPAHVIRFWESKFPNLRPVKYNNIRYFSPENIDILKKIKDLLYVQNYSIKDAAKYFVKPRLSVNMLEKVKAKLIKARERLNMVLDS